MQAVSKANRTQPINKGSFRRRRLVFLMLAGFMSWAGITLWNQEGKLSERQEKVSALQQKQLEAEQINSNVQREIERLNDPEYVEQKIRKDLHYVRPGETLFFTPKPQKQ